MKNKKYNTKTIVSGIILLLIFMTSLYLIINSNNDEGEYDYCVEWANPELVGTLHRTNLLYTCYNLATSTFYCDYEIQDNGNLMIKPIVNITKDEGVITEIVYDEPNYFNCTKWLKSKEVEK